ncbi:S-layer homology domain-containing protein [Flavonifractor plautii]|uniref:S-layer homology domain-containing protein n=1 Tax=Flavonifractor plautii TaxID=292800 RepID=UPI001899E74B|nr:S-layer homology domain-containing protein [Flavonifractor plautii]MDB7911450.1 S-layer homology domain-containing protein [Flavonifractor plautii]MDB7916900.1 S-layer homology domain-containing protein [Flavonifractor plautii]
MNKQRKAFLGLCLAGTLFLCTGFTISTAFSDVPVTSPYYQAVEYLADAGIVSGCGNSIYAPDRALTGGEYAAILARALRVDAQGFQEEGAPWFSGYVTRLYQEGVLTVPEYKFLSEGKVTWAVVWRTLLPHFGVYFYSAEYYYDTSTLPWYIHNEYNDSTVAAIKIGLHDPDASPTAVPTRGELAAVLYRLMVGDFVPLPESHIISSLLDEETPITPITFYRRNALLSATEILPEKVIESFLRNDWKVKLGGAYVDFPKYSSSSLAGLTVYANKCIYLECDRVSTVLHEFGHYMEYDTKSDLKVDKVFQQEHEHAKILLEDYAQTNAREYFACAIEEYFLNEEDHHIFEQELPLTYALVEDVLLNYA